MRRHLAAIVILGVVVAACADTTPGQSSTSVPATTTTLPAPTTTAAVTTTTMVETTTTTTTTAAPRVRFPGTVAQMLPTGPEDWDSAFIDPGAVIYHDDLFHSFYNGIESWPAHVRVGYATSGDGRKWDKQTADWLFTGEDLDWSGASIFVHDGIVLADGTWALYFSSVQSSTNFASGSIGIATAAAPTGPWTVAPNPILEPGADGAWDSDGVVDPSVIEFGDGYRMYYDGNIGGQRAIGLAVSTDGLTWTKHGEPVLTAGGEGDWDETGVYDPQVVVTDEGFVMSYFTRRPGASAPVYEVGLACSDDGLTWSKDEQGPYLDSEKWGFSGIFLSALVHHDDEYFFYFDAQRGSGGTTAFYVSHEGPLRP